MSKTSDQLKMEISNDMIRFQSIESKTVSSFLKLDCFELESFSIPNPTELILSIKNLKIALSMADESVQMYFSESGQ